MDEAQKYQQRLQAIAEKRRAQEEEDRVRREMEEGWLKSAQQKRKCLRDQWLMEPRPSSTETPEMETEPCTPAETSEESNLQNKIKGEDEKTSNLSDALPSQITEEPPGLSEAHREEPPQVNPAEEESKDASEMATNPEVFQNGQLDRSVLGVLEIQVERDLKTGTTTIKSMAPLPAALGATGEAVFDDGRRMVHAVGKIEGSQHLEEDLSQILNAISEVGMQTLLDGVAITSNDEQGGETETDKPELQQEPEDCHSAAARTPEVEEGWNERIDEVDKEEEMKGEVEAEEDDGEMVICRPEEGLDPVVLTFFGFTQVQTGSGLGYEDEGSVLKVEQVFMGSETDLSEELRPIRVENLAELEEPRPYRRASVSEMESPPEVTSAQDSGQLQEPKDSEAPEGPVEVSDDVESAADVPEDEAATRSGAEAVQREGASAKSLDDEVFLDVPLDGNGETLIRQDVSAQSTENEPEMQSLETPSRAEEDGKMAPKNLKMCQCCSVM